VDVISFRGEYPIGLVNYADPTAALTVGLEAFSPFVPLAWDDSSIPTTILRFTVKNVSAMPVEATLSGTLQNGAGRYTAETYAVIQKNQIVSEPGFTLLQGSVEADPTPADQPTVFEDWSQPGYSSWAVEGETFGAGPVAESLWPAAFKKQDADIPFFVSSHAGDSSGIKPFLKDERVGKLTSRPFTITKNYLFVWIAGQSHPGKTAFNLIVDGKTVLTAGGDNGRQLKKRGFDVRAWKGQQAHIEIVDGAKGTWGDLLVGPITFQDRRPPIQDLEKQPDFGSLGLALLGAPAEHTDVGVVDANGAAPIGTLGRVLNLSPGASAQVDFVVAWFFPNLDLNPFTERVGRSYGKQFDSALTVTRHVATEFLRLVDQTRLWRDTWYDSTLPYWFLDRTFLNTSTLATSTAYRFASDRFYGWEGVGSCPGTATHVWHYAQAPARLFPELERSLREMADYNPLAGFVDENGSIGFRGEFDRHWAADGMAGSILRVYREHQMSLDDAFLKRLWPRVKRSIQFLMSRDSDGDGLLDGPQHNSMDADWYGQIAWLSGMYAAALRAGEEMAREVGDETFAHSCRSAFDQSAKNLVAKLFDREYFINRIDPLHANTINSGAGCDIDQVLGQGWSWQVGLGRIFPETETRQALQSIWRYNFTPNIGAYQAGGKMNSKYAKEGAAGLLMCTFPRPDWTYAQAAAAGVPAYANYFNTCMNGFEHQAAGHMIAEGMVQEGLAVIRSIHDRYHPSKRNPWNELECGDHYSRSMASYGVFLAACGYEYHGPKGHLGFAPRLTPENFRAAFTTAEGWGSYFQKIAGASLHAGIELRHGALRLSSLAFELPENATSQNVKVTVDDKDLPVTFRQTGRRLEITLSQNMDLAVDGKLEITTS
jgi:non-lysosomal glucosylceramidase